MNADNDLIELAREFLTKVTGELDPFTSNKGVITNDTNSVTLESPEHIHFAKYGRPPGKQPPVNKILEFVKAKGIIFSGLTEEGTAWAIAKGIAKKGTLNYKQGAPNALEEAIEKHLKEYYNKVTTRISVTINSQIKELNKEIFPNELDLTV